MSAGLVVGLSIKRQKVIFNNWFGDAFNVVHDGDPSWTGFQLKH